MAYSERERKFTSAKNPTQNRGVGFPPVSQYDACTPSTEWRQVYGRRL